MHNIKVKQYAKKHEGMDTIRLSHISACKWCGNGFSEFLL
nr:MAG TPA: C2H2 type zinc-finger protein [Caudoviricetes sp.]